MTTQLSEAIENQDFAAAKSAKPAAAPKAQVPSTKVAPVEEVRGALSKMEGQFRMALPPHVPPEKFVRVVMTAIQQNGDLLGADRQSLYAACMKAAQDGLLPDGREAALVIFKGRVQYMPMTAGILKKVRNSGELSSLASHVVYERDEFDYWIDEEGEHLKHKPSLSGDRGKATHAYAVAKTKDGGIYIEVMTKAEIDKVRSVSRAKDDGPWVSWWDEMARKTVTRRLSKRLPMSTDLEQAITRDDELYDLPGKPTPSEPEPEAPPPAKPSRLGKIVEAKVRKAEPVQEAQTVPPAGEEKAEAEAPI